MLFLPASDHRYRVCDVFDMATHKNVVVARKDVVIVVNLITDSTHVKIVSPQPLSALIVNKTISPLIVLALNGPPRRKLKKL